MTIYEVVLESTPQLLTQWRAIAIDAYALGKHKTWEGEFRHQEISTIQVLSRGIRINMPGKKPAFKKPGFPLRRWL